MGDSHLLHTKVLITLNADNAVQKRFEVWRSERIRRGKRWVSKDILDHKWTDLGRVHIACPATMKWANREIGFWILIKAPVAPLPTEHYRREELAEFILSSADDVFSALTSEREWNLTTDISVWISVPLKISAGPRPPNASAREVEIADAQAKKLDAWIARLAAGEKRFNDARDYILNQVREHSASYEHIASELRGAARFIDNCETCDADPHGWTRDSFPGNLSRYLDDLLARKSASSHGFRVDFHYVHTGAYNASFPLYWHGWPPF